MNALVVSVSSCDLCPLTCSPISLAYLCIYKILLDKVNILCEWVVMLWAFEVTLSVVSASLEVVNSTIVECKEYGHW